MNPFQIKTPEKMDPNETINLFVDVFTDFEKIKTEGHTFIFGPRGIGKSMMLRYLQPDCQCVSSGNAVDKIDFLGLYIPLRNASFTTITELKRLENNASQIINEHIMSVYFIQMVFQILANEMLYGKGNETWDEKARDYYKTLCEDYFPPGNYQSYGGLKIHEIFDALAKQMEVFYREAINYTKKLSFTKDILPYDGPLFDYLGYVLPITVQLQEIECFSKKQIFFLVDDAHCLSRLQTHILNYWVSTRTSGEVSLKISTQYNYKNFYTITGATIDAPHDYSEIDMMKVYTSRAKRTYVQRITNIISKRLSNAGIDRTPEEFFPEDKEQEDKIKRIADEYKEKFDRGEGRGNKRSDDAIRYARPDYIKSLSGKSKSGSSYSYSGFNQLIHISSGIARSFLETAYKMYAEEESKEENDKNSILTISQQVQNEIVRDDANQFLFKELPKYAKDDSREGIIDDMAYSEEDIKRLSNLISGLGGLFREILVSERSERRVFSIAVSDNPSDIVQRILKLGVQLGYFHRSTIGKKDGMSGGRTYLYILNRRLAPIWNLDPTSFAGYLFVQNRLLEEAMANPDSLLRRLSKKLKTEENDIENGFVQLPLFPKENEDLFTIEPGDDNV